MGQHRTGLYLVALVLLPAHGRPGRMAHGRGYDAPHLRGRRLSHRAVRRPGLTPQRQPLGLWCQGSPHLAGRLEPFLLLPYHRRAHGRSDDRRQGCRPDALHHRPHAPGSPAREISVHRAGPTAYRSRLGGLCRQLDDGIRTYARREISEEDQGGHEEHRSTAQGNVHRPRRARLRPGHGHPEL